MGRRAAGFDGRSLHSLTRIWVGILVFSLFFLASYKDFCMGSSKIFVPLMHHLLHFLSARVTSRVLGVWVRQLELRSS